MTLKLDLSDPNVLKALKREIRYKHKRQKPITKVQVECLNAEFWVCAGASLSDDDIQVIFQHMGHAFPFLKELRMKVFELPLPVSALRTLLRLTKNTLEVIDMEDIILKGSQEEFEALAATFQEHPTLKTINLDWCQPMNGTLEPVLQGLCNIQTLNQVKICGSILSVASLRVLCNKQNLSRLSLSDDDLKDDAITAMAEAIESNDHIRELSVRLCGLDPATGVRFANVLRVNNTLEKLEIRIKDSDWNQYGEAFTDALKINSTLTDVALFIDGVNTDIPMAARHLMSTLSEHPSLKSVRIALRGITNTNALKEAFLDHITPMLQTNFVMETLRIDSLDLPAEASLLLQANHAGRYKLLQNFADSPRWIQTLIEQRANVPLSYYLISMNPSTIRLHK